MTEPPPGPGETTHPRLVALGRDIERTSHRVGELDTLVRQLCADVTALARRLSGPTPETGDAPEAGETAPEVRAWLLIEDPEQAVADLSDLIEWLHHVYLRHHGATLPSCWLWHPGVIEELWWLRRAHAEAYHPKTGSWLRVGDWHDRQRPGVVKRIKQAVHGCELALHKAGAVHAQPPTEVPLADAAGRIAAAWTATGRHNAPPEPSAAQLGEADRYDRAQHRSYR
jgi:hypothetical protein